MDPQVQTALIGVVASIITSTLGQVAGYLFILRWIIRRQVEGAWVLRKDHDDRMADKDRQIEAEKAVAQKWQEAWMAETAAGRVKDDTINKSVNANKVSDHFYETFMQKVPKMGDNDSDGGRSS